MLSLANCFDSQNTFPCKRSVCKHTIAGMWWRMFLVQVSVNIISSLARDPANPAEVTATNTSNVVATTRTRHWLFTSWTLTRNVCAALLTHKFWCDHGSRLIDCTTVLLNSGARPFVALATLANLKSVSVSIAMGQHVFGGDRHRLDPPKLMNSLECCT